MPTPYVAARTNTDYAQLFSDTVYDGVLATDTEQTLTVPSTAGRYKVVFKYSAAANVWVALNATAAKAAGALAAGASVLNPECREVKAGDVLHFITGDGSGASIGIEFYALNNMSGI